MLKFGDVVIAEIQFVDRFETKQRPALVLFEEFGNIVLMGITTNQYMKGLPIKRGEAGLDFDSIIKYNYIFTTPQERIKTLIGKLPEKFKTIVLQELRVRMK